MAEAAFDLEEAIYCITVDSFKTECVKISALEADVTSLVELN